MRDNGEVVSDNNERGGVSKKEKGERGMSEK